MNRIARICIRVRILLRRVHLAFLMAINRTNSKRALTATALVAFIQIPLGMILIIGFGQYRAAGYAFWLPAAIAFSCFGLVLAFYFIIALGCDASNRRNLRRRHLWYRVKQTYTGRNVCPNCGYDLRASPQRCPECGMPTPIDWVRTPGLFSIRGKRLKR
jgi:hypothetical protein